MIEKEELMKKAASTTVMLLAATLLTVSSCAKDAKEKTNKGAQKMQSVDTQPFMKPGEFKPAGHQYDVDFGAFKTHLNFISDKELTFPGMDGKPATVRIHPVKIRDNVYLVTWEEDNGSKVIHVEDFENHIIYTNVAFPVGSFLRLQGRVTQTQYAFWTCAGCGS